MSSMFHYVSSVLSYSVIGSLYTYHCLSSCICRMSPLYCCMFSLYFRMFPFSCHTFHPHCRMVPLYPLCSFRVFSLYWHMSLLYFHTFPPCCLRSTVCCLRFHVCCRMFPPNLTAVCSIYTAVSGREGRSAGRGGGETRVETFESCSAQSEQADMCRNFR